MPGSFEPIKIIQLPELSFSLSENTINVNFSSSDANQILKIQHNDVIYKFTPQDNIFPYSYNVPTLDYRYNYFLAGFTMSSFSSGTYSFGINRIYDVGYGNNLLGYTYGYVSVIAYIILVEYDTANNKVLNIEKVTITNWDFINYDEYYLHHYIQGIDTYYKVKQFGAYTFDYLRGKLVDIEEISFDNDFLTYSYYSDTTLQNSVTNYDIASYTGALFRYCFKIPNYIPEITYKVYDNGTEIDESQIIDSENEDINFGTNEHTKYIKYDFNSSLNSGWIYINFDITGDAHTEHTLCELIDENNNQVGLVTFDSSSGLVTFTVNGNSINISVEYNDVVVIYTPKEIILTDYNGNNVVSMPIDTPLSVKSISIGNSATNTDSTKSLLGEIYEIDISFVGVSSSYLKRTDDADLFGNNPYVFIGNMPFSPEEDSTSSGEEVPE